MRIRLILAALAAAATTPGFATAAPQWRLVEEVRVGPAESGPASFSTIRALTVDASGRIYVLENQPQDIRVFAPGGAFVRHVGRPGPGPGEYENASALAWDSLGRLLVVDEQHTRNSFFDSTGRFIESQIRPVSGFYGWNWGGAILNDGRTLEVLMIREPSGSRTALATVDPQGRLRDTLMFPPRSGEFWRFQRGTRSYVMPIPFMPGHVTAIDPRGFVWTARTDRYQIVQLSLKGDTIRSVTRSVPAIPVARAEVDSAVDAIAGRIGAGPDIDRSRIPATKPFFRSLLVDDEGRLWVRVQLPAGATGTAFDVFDVNGRYLDRAFTPLTLGINVLIRRGAMYADATSDDDLPYVVRLRIRNR